MCVFWRFKFKASCKGTSRHTSHFSNRPGRPSIIYSVDSTFSQVPLGFVYLSLGFLGAWALAKRSPAFSLFGGVRLLGKVACLSILFSQGPCWQGLGDILTFLMGKRALPLSHKEWSCFVKLTEPLDLPYNHSMELVPYKFYGCYGATGPCGLVKPTRVGEDRQLSSSTDLWGNKT